MTIRLCPEYSYTDSRKTPTLAVHFLTQSNHWLKESARPVDRFRLFRDRVTYAFMVLGSHK